MLKIALVQQPATEDREANRDRGIAAVEEAAARGAGLVCFAELAFDRFYPQDPASPEKLELAEPIPGPTTERLAAAAKRHGVVIVLNLFERAGDRTYDSSPVIDADGRLLGTTRMVHITDYACFHEKGYYAPGDRGAPVYDTAIGRVGVAICYDRHYPEYMRALGAAGAELVVIPQAGALDEWPEGMYEAEVRTASFQNGYFAALCNRVGREERLTFGGESFVVGPDGAMLARGPRLVEDLVVADVDLAACATSPARTLFWRDRRPETYRDWHLVGGAADSNGGHGG